MEQSTNIFLSGGAFNVRAVKVAPVVLLSVLDHFMRRPEGNKRVIGALLGNVTSDSTVEVRSSFPVSHSEGENVALDTDYFETMLELHAKVQPSESVVGWYGTGIATDDNSVLFHEFFGRSCPSPVHLLIDAHLDSDGFNPRAFVTTAYSIGELELSSEFREVPVAMQFSASEKFGLDALSQNRKKQELAMDEDEDEDDDAYDDERVMEPQNGAVSAKHSAETRTERKLMRLRAKYAMPSEVDNLERSLARLRELLDVVGDEVTAVVNGEREGDRRLGRFLSETLAMVPRIGLDEFDKMIGDSLRDHLMVLYCAKLTQVQLAMTEKLLAVEL
mmetsp:Transcript_17730/g.38453  ORF Transcript_17730/g.38453 Transcript_17730/m.38453 type:complete len:332 (+) Transcript_17730:33-1028(+)